MVAVDAEETGRTRYGAPCGAEDMRNDDKPEEIGAPQKAPLLAKHEKTPKTLGFSGFQVAVEGFEPPTRGL